MTRAQLTSTVEQNNAGAGAPFVAGKNKILNSDYSIWQRGTTSSTTGNTVYLADRWNCSTGSVSGFSQAQATFTPGTAPVAGYEGQYYMTVAGTITDATNGYILLSQNIEDVRTLSGQTATVSFWAKGSTTGNIAVSFFQNFGTGGSSAAAFGTTNNTAALTTSWQRFSFTVSVPSVAGKTIGTSSYLQLNINKTLGTAFAGNYGTTTFTGTMSIWGVQLESGSVATPFTTAMGTIQGELAACQRYYWRDYGGSNAPTIACTYTTNSAVISGNNPVVMRTAPAVSSNYTNGNYNVTWNLSQPTRAACTKTGSPSNAYFSTTTMWGICWDGGSFSPVPTAFQGSSAGYIEANSEL